MGAIDLGSLHLDQPISGWDVAFAAATVILTWVVGRLVQRGVRGLLARVSGITETARLVMARFAKYFVWIVGAGIAFSFLGAQVQPLLSAALIIAVIAVLALRGIAENFGAGLVIQTRHVIQLGDSIETMGYLGTVRAVNGQSVVIETVDGQTIHLPNAQVLQNPIVNDSANGRRRSDVEVRVLAGVDSIDRVRELVGAAIASTAAIDQSVAPMVATTSIEPHRVTLQVKVWHEPSAGLGARSDVVRAIAAALAGDFEATVQAPPPPAPPAPPPPV